MSKPISIAAGAFAVVGVLDVVVRASLGLSRFFSSIKDAPKEIERLRYCIEDDQLLVKSSSAYLSPLLAPPIAKIEEAVVHSVDLNLVHTAVAALQRELLGLEIISKKQHGTCKTWAQLRCVLDKHRIDMYLQKLEYAKSMLLLALSLASRSVLQIVDR